MKHFQTYLQLKSWILLTLICTTFIHSTTSIKFKPSPCPTKFAYEPVRDSTDDRWYGDITLPINATIEGSTIRIGLDRPSQLIVTTAGPITSKDNQVYIITHDNVYLEKGSTYKLTFMVKFDKSYAVPMLETIHFNGQRICPPDLVSLSLDGGNDYSSPRPDIKATEPTDVISDIDKRPNTPTRTTARPTYVNNNEGNFNYNTETPNVNRFTTSRNPNSNNFNSGGSNSNFGVDSGQQGGSNFNTGSSSNFGSNSNQGSNTFGSTNQNNFGSNFGTSTNSNNNFGTGSSGNSNFGTGSNGNNNFGTGTNNFGTDENSNQGNNGFSSGGNNGNLGNNGNSNQGNFGGNTNTNQGSFGNNGNSNQGNFGNNFGGSGSAQGNSIKNPNQGSNSFNTGNSNNFGSNGNNFNTGSNSNNGNKFNEGSTSGQVSCGTVSIANPLITLAQNTQYGQWPWHAALFMRDEVNPSRSSYICGGSLISKNKVITAAHCVSLSGNRIVNPDSLTVYVGKFNIHSDENTSQKRSVTDLKVNPKYNKANFHDDIAILTLASDIEYTNFVRPICLWESVEGIEDVVGKEGIVVGWGYNEHSQLNEELKMAPMPIVSADKCARSDAAFFAEYVSENAFCAGYKNGTGPCKGDSGGGLVIKRNDAWYLRGIVSVSAAPKNGSVCNTYHYIVFTDVAKYTDFIRRNI